MSTKAPKTFTYTLTLFERMIFLNIFPSRGDHTTQLLHQALSKKLITDEERNDIYQIQSVAECPQCNATQNYKDKIPSKCVTKDCKGKPRPTGGVVWRNKDDEDNDIPMDKEVTIGEMANATITRVLKELNEAEALETIHKVLYEKIVQGGTKELTSEEIDKLIMAPLPKVKKKE